LEDLIIEGGTAGVLAVAMSIDVDLRAEDLSGGEAAMLIKEAQQAFGREVP
jgi:hypothetical protein